MLWDAVHFIDGFFIFPSYAHLCHTLLEDETDTSEQFCQEFLPSLLTLLSDRIPNVRLSVARTLTKNILDTGMYTCILSLWYYNHYIISSEF